MWLLIVIVLVLIFFVALLYNPQKNKKQEDNKRKDVGELYDYFENQRLSSEKKNNYLPKQTNYRTQFPDYKKINVAIKGISYRSYSEIQRVKKLFIGEEVSLKRDYDNQYDKNATEVRTSDNVFIGYVDADYTQSVAMRIREEFDIRCFISKITIDDVPFVYMDIFYKDTFDKQKELTHEKVLLKKYVDYDLDNLLTLKWDINRFDINIDEETFDDIEERIDELFDDHIREKVRYYSIARLSNFLKTKEAENIGVELRKEIESRLNNESQIDKTERECSSIRSKISRLKIKGELTEIPLLEKELEGKYTELSLVKLSEKQSTELIIPDNLEELKKMSENWRTKILKAENMLNYQSESKKGKEPNPMPVGNKRTKLEGRIALLKEQKALIDSNIENLS